MLGNPALDIGPLPWSGKSADATQQPVLINMLSDMDVAIEFQSQDRI